ncbi:MAG: gamma carbonic anhydrase family protein [Halobacteriales archaeon]|nr:gamma carbonic anhydrase family protein [Halobacteriales archaeon]
MIRSLEGKEPNVPDSAFVSEMAYVVGDVTLGEKSSLWPFVCIRGDIGPTTVGEGSNVQDHSMLHEAEIGDDVTVGHNVTVDQSKVEDNCLVGIGSSVLQGAVVGEGSIVAAGAVVRERQEIPPGSLAYGVPAETRELNEAQEAQIPLYAQSYVENRERWKKAGGFDARD